VSETEKKKVFESGNSIRHKQFWDVHESRTLLGPKFTKESLGHEPDGLIFQPAREVHFGSFGDHQTRELAVLF
jgi:hypothetical protein